MAPTSQYPHQGGDITVLGPEIFASSDGAVICWKGENYTRQPDPAATEATQPTTSPLRDQVAAALLARIKQATVKPAPLWGGPVGSLLAANEFDLADAALAVVLPHGKSLGDELRDSERRLAETRTVLDEVLRAFVHKGHPGEPCLQTGWISVGTVERWRAVLYPPVPEGS